MSDTYNKKEKPVLTPPQGKLPKKSTSPLIFILIVISLIALLTLSAIVIWLLPSKSPLVPSQQSPVPIQTTAVNDIDAGLSSNDLEDSETELLLEAWLKSQASAEAENIQAWGGKEYADIKTSAAQGDQLFRSDEFSAAQTLYKGAIDNLEMLLASKEDKLRTALVQGKDALANEESNKALLTFQQALLIDPENEEALYGAHRANNLDHVLALYKDGLRLESENNFEQAQQLLLEASQTDRDYAPASEALKRVEKKRQDLSFQDAISRAITALNNEQLTVADKALEEAARLRPQDEALTTARQRSIEMHKIEKLKNLQIKADKFIRTENWGSVIETYGMAIQIDDKIGFATIGLPEAKNRFQLDKSLKSIIARPDRLQDEGPLLEAKQLLKKAQRIDNPGKVLQSQIRALSTLVQNASTTVEVILRSDNATEIEIYHFGRLRPFLEKSITLKPGTYTVVGRKSGFKDVRLSLVIKAEMKMPVFIIRCEEPI